MQGATILVIIAIAGIAATLTGSLGGVFNRRGRTTSRCLRASGAWAIPAWAIPAWPIPAAVSLLPLLRIYGNT